MAEPAAAPLPLRTSAAAVRRSAARGSRRGSGRARRGGHGHAQAHVLLLQLTQDCCAQREGGGVAVRRCTRGACRSRHAAAARARQARAQRAQPAPAPHAPPLLCAAAGAPAPAAPAPSAALRGVVAGAAPPPPCACPWPQPPAAAAGAAPAALAIALSTALSFSGALPSKFVFRRRYCAQPGCRSVAAQLPLSCRLQRLPRVCPSVAAPLRRHAPPAQPRAQRAQAAR